MSKVILVHGRNANGASWNGIESDLKVAASAPTLPGHRKPVRPPGEAQNPRDIFKDVAHPPVTMMDYVQSVAAKFPSDAHEKVTLIGHSMGGAVISHVAATYPDRVERLIYVAALFPAVGESIRDIEERLAQLGIAPGAVAAAFLKAIKISKGQALTALSWQPTGPLDARFIASETFKAIDKVYVSASRDSVVHPKLQKEWTDSGAFSNVEPMTTDHLPQYEERSELIDILNRNLP